MDSFEMNKIAGAVLFTLTMTLGFGILAEQAVPSAEAREARLRAGRGRTERRSGRGWSRRSGGADRKPPRQRQCQRKARRSSSAAPAAIRSTRAARTAPGRTSMACSAGRRRTATTLPIPTPSRRLHGQPWTLDDFNAFIHAPQKAVKGTKMSFAGLPKGQDRADVIAFLNTKSDSPVQFPAAQAASPEPIQKSGGTVKPDTPATTPPPVRAEHPDANALRSGTAADAPRQTPGGSHRPAVIAKPIAANQEDPSPAMAADSAAGRTTFRPRPAPFPGRSSASPITMRRTASPSCASRRRGARSRRRSSGALAVRRGRRADRRRRAMGGRPPARPAVPGRDASRRRRPPRRPASSATSPRASCAASGTKRRRSSSRRSDATRCGSSTASRSGSPACRGSRAERVRLIKEGWAAQQGLRDVLVFLTEYGLGPARAAKVSKRLGPKAIELMREDPYRLAREVKGVDFRTADPFAMRLGRTRGRSGPARRGPPRRRSRTRPRAAIAACRAARCSSARPASSTSTRSSWPAPLSAPPRKQSSSSPTRSRASPPFPAAALEGGGSDCRAPEARSPRARRRGARTGSTGAVLAAEARTGKRLAPAQALAVETALGSKLLVITGGPGVGKTTIIDTIVRALVRPRGQDRALRADRPGRQAHGGEHGPRGEDDPPPARDRSGHRPVPARRAPILSARTSSSPTRRA